MDKKSKDSFVSLYKIRSRISAGMALVGLLTALMHGFGFTRARVGFFAGCIFYAAAIICQIIFTCLAFSSASGGECEKEELSAGRRYIWRTAERTITFIIVILSFSFPLFVLPGGAYRGVYFSTFITWGLFYALVTFALCCVLRALSSRVALARGFYMLPPEDYQKYQSNLALQKHTIISVAIFVFVTGTGQIILNRAIEKSPLYYAEFLNFAAFKVYMETGQDAESALRQAPGFSDAVLDGEKIIKDPAQAPEKSVDIGGFHYKWAQVNQNTALIIWGKSENGFPARVYSSNGLQKLNSFRNFINAVFVLIYSEELIIGLAFYAKKRAVLSV